MKMFQAIESALSTLKTEAELLDLTPWDSADLQIRIEQLQAHVSVLKDQEIQHLGTEQ